MEIGLQMLVRRDWLDAAGRLVGEHATWSEARAELASRFQLTRPARKVLSILRRVWYAGGELPPPLQARAAALARRLDAESSGIVHALLILRAFPRTREVAAILEEEFRFHERVPARRVAARVMRYFGEDSNLSNALPKVLSTFSEVGYIRRSEAELLRPAATTIERPDLVAWCFECLLEIEGHPLPRKALEASPLLLGRTLHLTHAAVADAHGALELHLTGGREQIITLQRGYAAPAL
ncbi:MAG: hypothetical protein SFU83_05095 [Meiothermus sp.]|nr:hypothetical protein [Meiothermus sp.]